MREERGGKSSGTGAAVCCRRLCVYGGYKDGEMNVCMPVTY